MLLKRATAVFLIISMFFTLGCNVAVSEKKTSACEAVMLAFLNAITSADYNLAYEQLSASSKNNTDTPRANRVTITEFSEKYKAILSALEVTSIEYSDFELTEGELLSSCTFSMTYNTNTYGNFTNQFEAYLSLEDKEWKLEWSPSLIFPEMQWGDTVRFTTINAKRGEILAGGERLAATVNTITVYAVPSEIKDIELFTTQVMQLLDMKKDEVQLALSRAYMDMAVLGTFYSDELSEMVTTQLNSVQGVGIDTDSYGTQREYPYKDLMAHLIGYVGPISASSEEALVLELETLNANRQKTDGLYTEDSIVGRVGLERQYETQLRGKDGLLIAIRNSDGAIRKTLYKKEVENGLDIELSIDISLEQRLNEVLDMVLFGDTTAGAVIVMNPKTGEIQAISSYPSYDLNQFTRGISSTEYEKLLNDAAKPLINRATQGLYPPGSTMKAFTATAALDLDILDKGYTFDESEIEENEWFPSNYGNWIWSSIKRTQINNPIDGPLDMRKAMIHSDNIYFASVALKTGWENFSAYLDKAGFCDSISFDLQVATPQLVNKNTEMTYKLLADSGYGQGEILITPLQLASLFSAFRNEGNVPTPYLVDGIYKRTGFRYAADYENEYASWRENAVSTRAISIVEPMLKDVADPKINGTARTLRVSGCTVAAKTGTAEVGNDKSRQISWIVAYRLGVSLEDERLVLVMLEVPADDKYTPLKFDIAREMLNLEKKTDDN